MTRAEKAEATRQALIDAALEEFSERGLDASFDRISSRAGVTRGAFYVHFADREALIVAVMESVFGGLIDLVVGTGTGTLTTARALELFAAAAAARSPAVHGGRALRFHHLMDACRRSEQVGQRYRQLINGARDRLAALVAADQRAGRVRDDIDSGGLSGLLMLVALGVVAALELELEPELDAIAAAAATAIAVND